MLIVGDVTSAIWSFSTLNHNSLFCNPFSTAPAAFELFYKQLRVGENLMQ